jgi:hypothetical protein
MPRYVRLASLLLALGFAFAFGATPGRADPEPSFLHSLAKTPTLNVSTVPSNNDQNPYGVALVPGGFPGGTLQPGDVLVSNFNDSGNTQGTGTTIVAVTPGGKVSTFFTAPAPLGPVGLTTALAALPSGIVIVGNTPNVQGTVEDGSLIFIDARGNVLLNLSDSSLLQGPWDMAVDAQDPDDPILYVSNVLSGTVTRVNVHITQQGKPEIDQLTQVASGFEHRPDSNALVVGPTGLLLTADGNALYVADTGNNRIQFVSGVRDAQGDQGSGQTVFSGAPLRGPLALAQTPDGTIVASNGDAAGSPSTPPNMVVEIEPSEHEIVATRQLDTSGTAGGLFGIAVGALRGQTGLFYVDDNANTLNFLPANGR